MRRIPFFLFIAAVVLLPVVFAFADEPAVKVGQVAPDFALTDTGGRMQTLQAYRGRTIVLEWYDPGCKWNQKQYAGQLPKIQKSALEQGVTWFTIVSGGKGEHGHMTVADVLKNAKVDRKIKTIVLLDSENKVAKLYGAKKSLQTFVIDGNGNIVYMGAMDAGATAKPASIPSDKNYVYDAYRSVMEKTPVNISQTESYGCPLTL